MPWLIPQNPEKGRLRLSNIHRKLELGIRLTHLNYLEMYFPYTHLPCFLVNNYPLCNGSNLQRSFFPKEATSGLAGDRQYTCLVQLHECKNLHCCLTSQTQKGFKMFCYQYLQIIKSGGNSPFFFLNFELGSVKYRAGPTVCVKEVPQRTQRENIQALRKL